jgi:phospholipid transport system substrate-binding protein
MGDDGGTWQATDVLFNGTISKVAVQASDFSSEVSTGDATQLIAALKSKVAALSGGALQD